MGCLLEFQFIAVFSHSQIYVMFLNLGCFLRFRAVLSEAVFLNSSRCVPLIAVFSQSQSLLNYARAQLFEESVFIGNANFVGSDSLLG